MTAAERLARLRWIDDLTFEAQGVTFHIEDRPFDLKHASSQPDSAVVLKTRDFFEAYAEELDDAPAEQVLEFGVWRGGSALALAAFFAPRKFVALDISPPVAEFDQLRLRHPLGACIAVRYETSQDDPAAVDALIAEEFDGPLDLIIDDASHQYELSKRSFEIAFRHLRPGGWYVLEDWAWAHVEGWFMHFDQPALTNLVLRLSILSFCRPDLVQKVVVRKQAVFVRKGRAGDCGVLDLDSMMVMGGRPSLGVF